MLAIGVLYARLANQLPLSKLRELAAAAEDFFFWQAAGFLLILAASAIWRPRLLGRWTVGWLGLSTLAFLALSRDLGLVLKLALFVVWCLAAVRSLELGLERFVGEGQATWGLAAATLYGVGLLLAFFLGLFELLSLWPVALVATAIALPGLVSWIRRPPTVTSAARALDRLNPFGAAALEAMWVCLALAFAWAISPESFSDSIRSYLPDVQAMARHHSLAPQLVDVTRLMPRALQALCAMGYVVGGFQVAKWLSWFAIVPLAALIMGEIRRRSGDSNLGAVGAAVVITCPLLLNLSTTLMYDHVMTMLCVAGFFSLLRALDRDSSRGVLLSAFIMGAATSIKYNFLIFDVVWGLMLAAFAIRARGLWSGLRWCIAPGLVLGMAASPWLLYNWFLVGNPLFPFFNGIFQSPHWPPGQTTALKVDKFMLGEGIWNPVLFPWTVTFHTSRVEAGQDGRMGFALLALLPWILAIGRGWRRAGLGLGFAGAAIVAAVCSQIAIARYWLPGWPLLLMPLLLALGTGLERARLRWSHRAATLAAPMLLAALWIQVPFWTASLWRFPWPVYTQKVAAQEWTERLFPGLPAIEEFNRNVQPEDRVLATAYTGIYTIDADAYEFPYWHRRYFGIKDAASFGAHIERKGIRYWAVDFTTSDFAYFQGLLGADERYWTTDRLVAGEGFFGVFDVAKAPRLPRYSLIESRPVPLILKKARGKKRPREVDVFRDRFAKHPKKASRTVAKGIAIPAQGKIEYLFTVAPDSSLVRLAIGLQAEHLRHVSAQVDWLDGSRRSIGEPVHGRLRSRQLRIRTSFFAHVPDDARYGRLTLSRARREKMRLRSLRIDFLASAPIAEAL